jgi:hypothetical protein
MIPPEAPAVRPARRLTGTPAGDAIDGHDRRCSRRASPRPLPPSSPSQARPPRPGKAFSRTARLLCEAGFASHGIDFRAPGGSGGGFAVTTCDRQVADRLGALAFSAPALR